MKKIKILLELIKTSTKAQIITGTVVASMVIAGTVGGVYYYNNQNTPKNDNSIEVKVDENKDAAVSNEVAESEVIEELNNQIEEGTLSNEEIEKLQSEGKISEEKANEIKEKVSETKPTTNNTTTSSNGGSTSNNPSTSNSTGNTNTGASNNTGSTTPSNGGSTSNNTGSSNSGNSNNTGNSNTGTTAPSHKPKGYNAEMTKQFNDYMLRAGVSYSDSELGIPLYSSIKNYALNRTPIPSLEVEGFRTTGEVRTVTIKIDDKAYGPDDFAKYFHGGTEVYNVCFGSPCKGNYAVANNDGNGKIDVTIYHAVLVG